MSTGRRRSRASSHSSSSRLAPEVPTDPNTYTFSPRSRQRFVQLVALQCLVSPAPITNEHPIVLEAPTRENKRSLPQKTEREIADHFAFLAAGDGSGAACCIEERRNREGEVRLAFRVAMNEGVPESVVRGLRSVLREVRRVAGGDHSDADLKSAVWSTVLALSAPKIHVDLLERFTSGPRPLAPIFTDALSGSDPIPDPEAHSAVQRIHDLLTRVTSTDASSALRDLDRLLDTCYRFRSSRCFKSGLKAIPSRRQLVQTVEKLGRYKTASNALVLAARKFPGLFAEVDVDTVLNLPEMNEATATGFKGVYVGDVAMELTGCAEALCMSRLRTATEMSSERLASKYQELCQSAPTAHAEIQMVKFYEEHPYIDRPGFIGCSKKSCFLCGLFLQLQRRYTVSKAHQNIYHTWTVPTIRCASPENAVMLDFVVEKMARVIEDSCRKMLWEEPTAAAAAAAAASEAASGHKSLIATLPMVAPSPISSFATPRSPLSPIEMSFSRPSTAASNLANIRASSRLTPKPQPAPQQQQQQQQASSPPPPPSKLTDSSGDSSSPEEPGSPNPSSESSCTSVSEDSSKESETPKRHSRSSTSTIKHVETAVAVAAAAAAVERMPAMIATDAPPLPQRSASRASKESPRPSSSARSTRKRVSPVETPKTETPITTTITRSQSVRAPRKSVGPAPTTPKAPVRSASVARRPNTAAAAAAPEIPARRGHARSASAMEVRKPVLSDTESISPRTRSKPFVPGPLKRANTAPEAAKPVPAPAATPTAAAAKSGIPMPRSVSRSNRKATSQSTPPSRSPSTVRYVRMENPVHHDERPPSPGHITSSLLQATRESPISVARLETAMAMAVTPVTGSPTMVDLCKGNSSSSETSSTRGSPNVARLSGSRSRAGKRMSPLSVERKVGDALETAATAVEVVESPPPPPPAGLGLKKSTSSRTSLRDSFVSAATSTPLSQAQSQTSSMADVISPDPVPVPSTPSPLSLPVQLPPSPVHTDIEDTTHHGVPTPHGISIVDSSEESSLPTPTRRSLTERRGRALKRVDATSTTSRKRAAIDRATADAAASVQENGFVAQRKRGMTIADVVQASGFRAQLNRGMVPRVGYYSDTETAVRTRLRGGALSTISSEEGAGTGVGTSSLARRRKQETEYTLYLAGPDHDDRTLGEKIFNGRLSDGNRSGGELKQRVGCKVRTALRPAEKEISGMRVKEVAKSMEEMVLDIFFPDAVLRLEVVWDGNGAGVSGESEQTMAESA